VAQRVGDIRLKASQDCQQREREMVYALEAEAYNRLVAHAGGLIALVLFCVPDDPAARVDLTEEYLRLRRCCYQYAQPPTITENKRSVSIAIPRSQMFTPQACQALMQRVREGA
jgi:hypothetical protein